jgi:hypothetical protein
MPTAIFKDDVLQLLEGGAQIIDVLPHAEMDKAWPLLFQKGCGDADALALHKTPFCGEYLAGWISAPI